MNSIPETPAVLDEIKKLVKDHRYFPVDDKAEITLHDGKKYTLKSEPTPEPGIVPHIGMFNEWRSISFENVSELKGWLRCHRAEYMFK